MSLSAVSPIDGRYANTTKPLSDFFSEFALFKYRVFIEVEYFVELCSVLPQLKKVEQSQLDKLRSFTEGTAFTESDAQMIKDIEAKTNHDVKAVEYYLQDK